jgi:hypothetical protein
MKRQPRRVQSFLSVIACILLLLSVAAPAALAQEFSGTFLTIPLDVVGAGMGGADVARFSHGISPFANPAGSAVTHSSATLTHELWLAEQRVNALSVQMPLQKGRSGLALTGRMVNHATVPRFDASGARMGSLEPQDLSLGAAYAMRFGMVTLGAGAQYIQENLEVAKGTGFSFDLGALMDVGPARVGVAGTNLFGYLDYDGSSYDPPRRLAGGVAVSPGLHDLEFVAQYNDRRYGDKDLALGAQWSGMHGILNLRAGYVALTESAQQESFSPLRFGFTIAHSGLALDYAYVPHKELGQAHLLSLRWMKQ